MSKFLDRVLSDNPQLDFQEIYEYSLKDFLFSSGNDSRILLEYPNICREQLENAIVKIVDWVPDESGANNINVVVKIPAIFYIIPKTGKPKDIKKRILKENLLDDYIFTVDGKCYESEEKLQKNKPLCSCNKVVYDSKFVDAYFHSGGFLNKVFTSEPIEEIKMQVFEPELVSFLYVKLLRNEYSFLQIRREVEALKRSIDNLVAVTALPKDKSADGDDSQEFAGEYLDSKPFAGIGETASSELELETEEHNEPTGEYYPPKLGSMASAVDNILKSKTEEYVKKITENSIDESVQNSETAAEDEENVVAIVQMDCDGNITGVIPNPVQEEIDSVTKVEGE